MFNELSKTGKLDKIIEEFKKIILPQGIPDVITINQVADGVLETQGKKVVQNLTSDRFNNILFRDLNSILGEIETDPNKYPKWQSLLKSQGLENIKYDNPSNEAVRLFLLDLLAGFSNDKIGKYEKLINALNKRNLFGKFVQTELREIANKFLDKIDPHLTGQAKINLDLIRRKLN